MTDRLKTIRTEIDVVDDSIAKLLCKRAELAKAVREIKANDKINPYSPTREKEIIERVLPACIEAGFSPKSIQQIFLSILSASRAIVGVFEVCFPDYKGSVTHRAMINQFGPIDNFKVMPSMSDCLDRVVNGLSQFAIVPISKNSAGIISETVEELIRRPLRVFSSVSVVEDYSLYGNTESLKNVEVIYGFGPALSKVSGWANSVLPDARLEIINSYSALEKLVTEIQPGSKKAILLGTGFSEELNLAPLIERIPLTNPDNIKYFVLEPIEENETRDGENVTSIVCAIKDMVGALSSILEPFSKRSITLRKIESRSPQNISWECIFYIEADGASYSEEIKACIKELEDKCTFVKVLGGFKGN